MWTTIYWIVSFIIIFFVLRRLFKNNLSLIFKEENGSWTAIGKFDYVIRQEGDRFHLYVYLNDVIIYERVKKTLLGAMRAAEFKEIYDLP